MSLNPPQDLRTVLARPDALPLTFERLTVWEPQLADLARRAEAVRRNRGRRRRVCWRKIFVNECFSAQLDRLVGWSRVNRHPDSEVEKVLRSQLALDLAVEAIVRRLPRCRGCG